MCMSSHNFMIMMQLGSSCRIEIEHAEAIPTVYTQTYKAIPLVVTVQSFDPVGQKT